MLRGEKSKTTTISKGHTVLNSRVFYAMYHSVTAKDKTVGFSQWGEQGRAWVGGKEERTNLFGITK